VKNLLRILILICCLPGWSNLAAAAPAESGGVRVLVQFALPSGELQPLPGATVTLLDGAKRSLAQDVTLDDGTLRFPGVAAGQYLVQAEMAGFRTIREKLDYAAGAEISVTVILPLEELSTVVDVTAESRAEEQKQTELPATLKEQLLKSAPLVNERFQDALPMVPGVVRGPDGLLNLKGARTDQSGLLVNSVNVTDPVTGQYAMELPIEAIDSVQVHANPYSAEFGKFTGAVTTIETRQGTDEFKFLITNFFPRFRWNEGPLLTLESFTPRVAASGALVPGRLYYLQNLEYRYILTKVPSLPDHHNDTRLETFDSFTRLDWLINDSHRTTAAFSLYPQNLTYVNLNTFHPEEVTPNFRQRGWFLALSERSIRQLNSVLESTFSIKQFDAHIWGNGLEDMTISPDTWGGNFYNTQDRFSRRYEFSQLLTLNQLRFKGLHNPKIGYTLSRADFAGLDQNRPVLILRADGTLYQRYEYQGPGDLDAGVTEFTAFAQDRWQLGGRLTLDAGLRLDWDSLGRQFNLAPRFGFAWLPFPGSTRTVIRGGLGIFYDKIPLNAGVFEQYQAVRVTNYGADGATIVAGPVLFHNVADPAGLKNPYSIAGNVELDHELLRNLFLRVGVQNREVRDELLLEPILGEAPVLRLSNRGSSRYLEWLASLRYRFRRGDEFTFSYVRSSAVGNLNSFETYFGNYHYPVVRPDEIGPQPFDAPDRFLLTGLANLPWGLVFSPIIEIRDGFPYSQIDERQDFVSPRNRGGRFPWFFSWDMSIVKKWDIKFMGKVYHTQIGVKIYNLTNHWNPRDVQNNIDSPAFGTFYNSVERTYRGKFEIEF